MKILQRIIDCSKALKNTSSFKNWLQNENCSAGDLVLFNSSFLQREGLEVSSKKSGKCLALLINSKKNVGNIPYFVENQFFNTEFKRLPKQQNVVYTRITKTSLLKEFRNLGDLSFSLIGNILTQDTSEDINGIAGIDKLIWRPNSTLDLDIQGKEVIIREPFDHTSLWTDFKGKMKSLGNNVQETSHSKKFIASLRLIQRKGSAKLVIPSRGEPIKKVGNFLDRVITALQNQLQEYKIALKNGEQIDVLRIAYNFTSDVLSMLRLIITICDLKPMIQWATADKHLLLWEFLQSLPWLRSNHKPSIQEYIRAVNDSRNQSFHDALPFQQTMSISLSGVNLPGAQVQFLHEYVDKKESGFTFDDYELVKAVSNFSRAHRIDLPTGFWSKNIYVLNAIIDFFSEVENTLRITREAMT